MMANWCVLQEKRKEGKEGGNRGKRCVLQARSHGVAWGGKCPPEQLDAIFLPPLRILLQISVIAISL